MTIFLQKNWINYGIISILFGVLILLMKSSFLPESNSLSLAITIDLLISIPTIYLLLTHKTQIPKTNIISVIIIGYLIGSFFLPQENQKYLNLFKTWILPVLQISVFTFAIFKFRSALKLYNKLKNTSSDFFDIIKKCSFQILPKSFAITIATEIAVIHYGFVNWRTIKLKENEFSYHKNSGTPALLYAFILIICIETTYIHFLLIEWNFLAAWVLTILSTYTGIQFFGFAKSLSKRPISIDTDNLSLKYGILNEGKIPFSDINNIVISKSYLDKEIALKTLSPIGKLENYNVIINLNKENELIGLYGMKKRFKTLGLHIDEPNDFKEKIENALQQNTVIKS